MRPEQLPRPTQHNGHVDYPDEPFNPADGPTISWYGVVGTLAGLGAMVSLFGLGVWKLIELVAGAF